MYYAQINETTRICIALTETHSAIAADHMIEVPAFDPSLVGKRHNADGNVFEEVPVESPAPARILTHLQFRRRFTTQEQELSDELEATFETSDALTVAQKRALRTGYKNFNAASEVDLDDPDIPPMLGLYVALGNLASHRPAEILA